MKADKDIFAGIGDDAPDESMISIAEKIIEQKQADFDPSLFKDRYEDALKALIEAKQKGHKVETVAEPTDTNVVDLMTALRASLGQKPGKAAPTKAAPAKKAAPKTKAKATPSRRKAG